MAQQRCLRRSRLRPERSSRRIQNGGAVSSSSTSWTASPRLFRTASFTSSSTTSTPTRRTSSGSRPIPMCNFISRRPARLGSIRSRSGSRSCRGSRLAAPSSTASNSTISTSMPTSRRITNRLSHSSGPRKRSGNAASKADVSLSYDSGYYTANHSILWAIISAVCDLLRAVSVIINAPLMTGHPNAAAPASALALSRNATRALNMLRENANNVAFDVRSFVEQVGGYSLDSVAMGHKLRLPRDAWRTLCLCQLIHSGITDLALHSFTVVHHRKCERQPLVVVSNNLATCQWHRNTIPYVIH